MEPINVDRLIDVRNRLYAALDKKRSERWCLTLWSRFIRARDAYSCVVCNSSNKVQAHHLFRRTLLPQARFELGNGISLCLECHRLAHDGFNGRPDMNLPIGAQGGDDQDEIAFYYRKLLESAEAQNLSHEEFYSLSDEMLRFFVNVQGFEFLHRAVLQKKISRLTMAYQIWARAPEVLSLAIFKANVPGYSGGELPEFMVGYPAIFICR